MATITVQVFSDGKLVSTGTETFPDGSINYQIIAANLATHLTQIETWLAANPNGAILTAAQTAYLARSIVGLARITLGLVSTVGQAT